MTATSLVAHAPAEPKSQRRESAADGVEFVFGRLGGLPFVAPGSPFLRTSRAYCRRVPSVRLRSRESIDGLENKTFKRNCLYARHTKIQPAYGSSTDFPSHITHPSTSVCTRHLDSQFGLSTEAESLR